MFGGGKRRPLAALFCAAALLVALGVGCGGDDGDSTAASEGPKFSSANEPVGVFIKRFVKLLETTERRADCPQLDEISARSYVRFSCPPGKALRKSMRSFEIVGAKEYGSGGVVDYKSGKVEDGAAIVLFVAPDRNWGVGRFGVVTPPSTKTTDEDSREGFEEALDDYFAAVRDRDCAGFQKVAFVDPAVKTKDICTKVFGATKELATRLRESPDVEPKYEGGNASYGFFSYETEKPDENSTISLIRAGGGDSASSLVLDVAPSPTALEQEAIRKQFEEQRKQGDKPKMSPSRRAD